MSILALAAKTSSETRTIDFDFISALGLSETLSTASVSASVFSGLDTNPSALISGTATISGTEVTQKITGGVAGTIYKLICQVTTSAGQTLQYLAYLSVVDDPI